jgi:hypothetical protein
MTVSSGRDHSGVARPVHEVIGGLAPAKGPTGVVAGLRTCCRIRSEAMPPRRLCYEAGQSYRPWWAFLEMETVFVVPPVAARALVG